MSDEPLSPAEIAAWTRRGIELSVLLPPGEHSDREVRILRQIAETFERLCVVTGGRSLASDASGQVHLPAEHIRRAIANEVAVQLAPMLRITEEWDGVNRRRNYTASIMIVLPKEITK